MIDLTDFAGGAVTERFNQELQKALENIADPNTDPKKSRTVTVKVTLKADENRDIADVDITTSSSLVAAKPVLTKILMDRDGKGNVVGAELKSGNKGQTYINEKDQVADDTGKVIDLRASATK
ncbi:replication terminator protein [Brevibacillus porteri]|uniref:Replication terminator protein n=2 Tax=Brevibacillus porteri TaxID=2126350 RepID=A0ABX5FSF8_9BACL|nr:replication terminator protein [Brevibacillus porteri]